MDLVLTADADWASEHCLESFLQLSAELDIVPTLFVTHESPAVRRFERAGRVELAIHPNFMPGSSHGVGVDAVIGHVLGLVPKAKAFRAHRYFANDAVAEGVGKVGLTLDSNAYRHLQRGLRPRRMANGLVQLTVFFEDDVHWLQGLAWDFERYRDVLFSDGLKIFNFHPFFVTLNIPDAVTYNRRKSHVRTLTMDEAKRLRHEGPGPATFLSDMIKAARQDGHEFITLSELASRVSAETAYGAEVR